MSDIESSKKFNVNLRDTGKALIMAVGTAVCAFLLKSLSAGTLVWDWKGIVIASISGCLTFITMTFFTPPPK